MKSKRNSMQYYKSKWNTHSNHMLSNKKKWECIRCWTDVQIQSKVFNLKLQWNLQIWVLKRRRKCSKIQIYIPWIIIKFDELMAMSEVRWSSKHFRIHSRIAQLTCGVLELEMCNSIGISWKSGWLRYAFFVMAIYLIRAFDFDFVIHLFVYFSANNKSINGFKRRFYRWFISSSILH